MFITENIKFIGVFDEVTDLFESQYRIPEGVSYNSYLILDEKIAVMDTADKRFGDEWLKNLDAALEGRAPDYLIVHHMEPDHSANIVRFTETYPSAKIVASAKAFAMMKSFFGTDLTERGITVKEGDKLSLGEHELTFISAPMVHWPEVIVSYEKSTKTLFSADGFGTFGKNDTTEVWPDEARRYYIGIVGKYGAQVQALLKKTAALDIARICPLHGPILSENLGYYIGLYDTWSSYRPESEGTVIAYTSVYGNTRAAAEKLRDELNQKGVETKIYDLSRCDMSEAIADAFRYSTLVLATTTYNADIFPPMREFINHLTERNFSCRKVGLIENGSWAPMAAKVMRGMLEGSKGITFTETGVKIISAPNEENNEQINALANELCLK